MYSVDSRDEVHVIEAPHVSSGAPFPYVVATESEVILRYTAVEGETARVVFSGPLAHFFGPPSDEALRGHPLYARGLKSYGTFEIAPSSWIRALEILNEVHPQHNPVHFKNYRHYVFTFHDSLFECVAENLTVSSEHRTL